jgi:uncharacterized protein (DUF362 family)
LLATDFSVPSGVPIIIKPNLCCIKGAETGATTDPLIVESIVDYIKEKFSPEKTLIVESDATALNANLAFKLLGYEKLAKKIDAEIVNLSSTSFQKVSFPINYYLHRLKVPEVFLAPHFLISVPKLKTHTLCSFTASLKNVYGCNPEPFKAKYHSRLHEAVADFASVFRPHFTVVDAVISMEGNGPVDGKPIRTNRIIAGTDPVAVDTYLSKLMGFDASDVAYLRYSEKRGIGSSRYQLVSKSQERPLLMATQITDELVKNAEKLINLIRRNQVRRH